MNSLSPQCPECGTALTEESPDGLCPACLLQAAMQPTADGPLLEEAPDLAEIGKAFPQWEVIRLIGRGGMGAVYQIRQPKLNRFAALKIIPARVAERDSAFAGRFDREGELLARLHHPNIVHVHDSGRAGDFYYLLMEHVDGVNLRQAMRAGRFTPQQALAVVPKICEALQYAHDEGVLHRDIKPENILLDNKGRVKLADFGIAKLMGSTAPAGPATAAGSSALSNAAPDPAADALTKAGASLGTPRYMAPEQAERPREVDHRADIYSLGVVFYELLTGRLPEDAVFSPPSSHVDVDQRVDAIVRQALEKERELRQHSAGEMRTQVEIVTASPASRIAAENPASATAAQAGAAASAPVRWRISLLAVAAALLAIRGVAHGLVTTFIYPMLITKWFLFGPIAGTILGWLAVVKIRRSQGRLRGLSLALIGALALLLITLNSWITQYSMGAAFGLFEGWVEFTGPTRYVISVTCCLFWILADIWIIREARKLLLQSASFANFRNPAESVQHHEHPLGRTLLLHTLTIGVFCALLFYWLSLYAEILRSKNLPLTVTARFFQEIGIHFAPVLFPVVLLADIGCCFVIRDLWGRTGVKRWSIGLFCGMWIVPGIVGSQLLSAKNRAPQPENSTEKRDKDRRPAGNWHDAALLPGTNRIRPEEARRIYTLTKARYEAGLSVQTEVLDAKHDMLIAEAVEARNPQAIAAANKEWGKARYDSAKARYEAGAGTYVEMLDAKRLFDLTEADGDPVKTQAANLDWAQARLKQAEDLHKVGMANETDVLRARSELEKIKNLPSVTREVK